MAAMGRRSENGEDFETEPWSPREERALDIDLRRGPTTVEEQSELQRLFKLVRTAFHGPLEASAAFRRMLELPELEGYHR